MDLEKAKDYLIKRPMLITKLKDAIFDLENAININDIHNVADDLKRIVKEMEG
jgi:hypothetical protein